MKIADIAASVDRASIYAVTGRVLSGLSGLASVAIVSTTMSRSMQGYFFSFLSMATMQVLLDLGMGTVMINFVAHEWAAANHHPQPLVSTSGLRLASLAKFALRWYSAAALVMFATFQLIGFFLFAKAHDAAIWPGPWLLLSGFVALDMGLLAAWTVLEGCNKVETVYGYRAARTATLSIGMCVALLLGAQLWSVGIGYACTVPLAFIVLRGRESRFLAGLLRTKVDTHVTWRKELLPMQWRTSLVSFANYAAIWAVTPITLAALGPIPAGQVGMTWTLINAISGIAFAVVAVKAPTYGRLVSQKAYVELDRTALAVSGLSVLLSALSCGLLVLATVVLHARGVGFATRLLPPLAVEILAIATVAGQTVGPQLTYMRAFKREPYPWVQITFAALVLIAITVGGRSFGVYGIVWGYFFAVVAFLVPVTALSTWHYRRLWMAER